MGFFSKIFKGIKKFVKKIGKGIKKIVKKVGMAVGKLGIVGQIGMMFLMPYAMGALGTFFGGLNAAQVGTWAHTLAQGGKFAQTVSSVMNTIHTVGTAVIKPFTFVRDQIGEAVNWIGKKTNTVNLTDGVNKLIGYDPETRLKKIDLESIRSKYKSIPTVGGAAESTFVGPLRPTESTFVGPLRPDAITGEAITGEAITGMGQTLQEIGADTSRNLLDKELSFPLEGSDVSWKPPADRLVPTFKEAVKTTFEEGTKSLSSLNSTEKKGWFAKQGESLVNAVKDFSVGEVVSSGLRRGGSDRIAYAVAGDPPRQRILQTVRREADLLGLSNQFSDSTVFRSVNLASERQGNVWLGTNALNYDYMKSIGNDGTANYYSDMRNLEFMNPIYGR